MSTLLTAFTVQVQGMIYKFCSQLLPLVPGKFEITTLFHATNNIGSAHVKTKDKASLCRLPVLHKHC